MTMTDSCCISDRIAPYFKDYLDKYGIDYNLGDFVTLRDNDLCIDFDLQITSVTKSISETGEITDIKFGREKLSLNKIVKRGK